MTDVPETAYKSAMRPSMLLVCVVALGCGQEAEPQGSPAEPERRLRTEDDNGMRPVAGRLSWIAPPPFVSRRPENEMRSHEYDVRGHEGATLGVFHFETHEGGGGTVDANIDRWLGQLTQPDGRATREAARIERRTVNELRVTTVDVTGTFVGRMGMGGPAGPPREGWRLLGAIVEGPEGLVFFKLIGPGEAVDAADDAFQALVRSIRRL